MELTLNPQTATRVTVAVDGQPSHTFDLRQLAPDETRPDRPPQPLADPVAYGQGVYRALAEYRRALEITAAPGVVGDALPDLKLKRAAGVKRLEPVFELLQDRIEKS